MPAVDPRETLVRLASLASATRAQVGELRAQLAELRRAIAELRGTEPEHAGAEATRTPRDTQEEV